MLRMIQIVVATLGLVMAGTAWTQAPSGAPAGTTGLCKDGSYSSAAKKQGACRGHRGVQTWYGSAAAATGAAAGGPASAAPSAPPVKNAPSARTPAVPQAAAPGGGAGQVWVNTRSKVYHCPGDRYYGKTKAGAYMSEADARAQGNRPDHGKACK